jgi:NADH:ubiquinone oxidoreductase subunit
MKWVNYWSYILICERLVGGKEYNDAVIELKEAYDSVRRYVLYNNLIEGGIHMKW